MRSRIRAQAAGESRTASAVGSELGAAPAVAPAGGKVDAASAGAHSAGAAGSNRVRRRYPSLYDAPGITLFSWRNSAGRQVAARFLPSGANGNKPDVSNINLKNGRIVAFEVHNKTVRRVHTPPACQEALEFLRRATSDYTDVKLQGWSRGEAWARGARTAVLTPADKLLLTISPKDAQQIEIAVGYTEGKKIEDSVTRKIFHMIPPRAYNRRVTKIIDRLRLSKDRKVAVSTMPFRGNHRGFAFKQGDIATILTYISSGTEPSLEIPHPTTDWAKAISLHREIVRFLRTKRPASIEKARGDIKRITTESQTAAGAAGEPGRAAGKSSIPDSEAGALGNAKEIAQVFGFINPADRVTPLNMNFSLQEVWWLPDNNEAVLVYWYNNALYIVHQNGADNGPFAQGSAIYNEKYAGHERVATVEHAKKFIDLAAAEPIPSPGRKLKFNKVSGNLYYFDDGSWKKYDLENWLQGVAEMPDGHRLKELYGGLRNLPEDELRHVYNITAQAYAELGSHMIWASEYLSQRRACLTNAQIHVKPDGSKVTEPELVVQNTFNILIEQKFPSMTVIGEEKSRRGSGAQWVAFRDPADGTRAYVDPKKSNNNYLTTMTLTYTDSNGNVYPILTIIIAPEYLDGKPLCLVAGLGIDGVMVNGRLLTAPTTEPHLKDLVASVSLLKPNLPYNEKYVNALKTGEAKETREAPDNMALFTMPLSIDDPNIPAIAPLGEYLLWDVVPIWHVMNILGSVMTLDGRPFKLERASLDEIMGKLESGEPAPDVRAPALVFSASETAAREFLDAYRTAADANGSLDEALKGIAARLEAV